MFGLSITSAVSLGIALLAGAAIPFQAASNAMIGRALGHPLWATVASLTVSMLMVLPVLLALRVPAPNLAAALQGPAWGWLGGVAGVIYVTAALMLTPRLGAGTFIVAVIAGQVIVSMLIDHYGWMGLPVRPVTWLRLAGLVLILGGMMMVAMAGSSAAREGSARDGAMQGGAMQGGAVQVGAERTARCIPDVHSAQA
jgi:transporter family-2 protein